MSDFADVGRFHEKFGLHQVNRNAYGPTGVEEDKHLMDFRLLFLHEELMEFQLGLHEKDHAQMFDALIDLVYVALGTAHLLGYPWPMGWSLVQSANMKKVKANADGSNSKRNSSFDVVKPEGWEPPNIQKLLESWGYDH